MRLEVGLAVLFVWFTALFGACIREAMIFNRAGDCIFFTILCCIFIGLQAWLVQENW